VVTEGTRTLATRKPLPETLKLFLPPLEHPEVAREAPLARDAHVGSRERREATEHGGTDGAVRVVSRYHQTAAVAAAARALLP